MGINWENNKNDQQSQNHDTDEKIRRQHKKKEKKLKEKMVANFELVEIFYSMLTVDRTRKNFLISIKKSGNIFQTVMTANY